MRRRAHAETPFILVFLQLLALVPPILLWHKRGAPPAWTVWLTFQLFPALFIIGILAMGFWGECLDNLWRRYKTKKNRH